MHCSLVILRSLTRFDSVTPECGQFLARLGVLAGGHCEYVSLRDVPLLFGSDKARKAFHAALILGPDNGDYTSFVFRRRHCACLTDPPGARLSLRLGMKKP